MLAEHMSNYLCNLGLDVLRKVQFIGSFEAQPTSHNKRLTTPVTPQPKVFSESSLNVFLLVYTFLCEIKPI